MATNNARARAAREYVKAHPGTKYTEALRIVSQEGPPDMDAQASPAERTFATIGLPGTGKTTALVRSEHDYPPIAYDTKKDFVIGDPGWRKTAFSVETLLSRHTRVAWEEGAKAIQEDLPSATLTNLRGKPGVGKTFALMEHAKHMEVPLRVIFTATGEWLDVVEPGSIILRALPEEPLGMEATRYEAVRSVAHDAAESTARTLVIDLSPVSGTTLGSLGVTWSRIGEALIAAAPEFFEIILDGDFWHSRDSDKPSEVEDLIQTVARLARSNGSAAHIIYTGYGETPVGLRRSPARAQWGVYGQEKPETPAPVDSPLWGRLFTESRGLGAFWVEDPEQGGWYPVRVVRGGTVMLSFPGESESAPQETDGGIDHNVPNDVDEA